MVWVPLLVLTSVPFFKGVSLTPWSWDALGTPNCRASIGQMAKDGVDTVAVNVWEFQYHVGSTVIAPDAKSYSSSPESIRRAIRWAHVRGMKVVLKPIVDPHDGKWRGEIPASDAWFRSYRSFISRYADLAREEKVEAFSVGCEYNGLQGDERQWRAIVALVRSRYHGLLTYAANFDSYAKVRWWDALDFVGIDAYFSLTRKKNPTVDELKTAWTKQADAIGSWLERSGLKLPVVFTEIGYRSVDGANTAPWDFNMKGPVDLQEQIDCLRAMYGVMGGRTWWRGAYLWNWEVDPTAGGPKASNYTPQNKPAEGWLREWFGRK